MRIFRGVERIRTAVDGVADHCLATRPRHPILDSKYKNIYCSTLFTVLFSFLTHFDSHHFYITANWWVYLTNTNSYF